MSEFRNILPEFDWKLLGIMIMSLAAQVAWNSVGESTDQDTDGQMGGDVIVWHMDLAEAAEMVGDKVEEAFELVDTHDADVVSN